MYKLTLFIFLLLSTPSFGQEWQFNYSKKLDSKLKRKIERQTNFYFNTQTFIHQIYLQCAEHGYITADISIKDSVVFVQLGRKYNWLLIDYDETASFWIKRQGFQKAWKNSVIKPAQFKFQMEELLGALHENGYPMAKIRLDSIDLSDSSISGRVIIEQGAFIEFGKIQNLGGLSIAPSYIYGVIDIKPGDKFQMSKWKLIDTRLQEIYFSKFIQPSKYKITRSKLDIDLFLDEKKVNIFQGIVGYQTSENQAQGSFTGDFSMKIYNSMQYGSLFGLDWRGFAGGGQIADLEFEYPYIGGLDIGLNYALNFQRFDTSFLNVHQQFGINYLFSLRNRIFIGFDQESSVLIEVPVEQIKSSNQLPSQLDQRSNGYFIKYLFSSANDEILFKKGLKISFNSKLYRTIFLQNEMILNIEDDTDFSSAYDSLQTKENIRTNLKAQWAVSLDKKSVLIPCFTIGHNLNENLLINETFLIGGMSTLRGFDEQSIRLSDYAIAVLSYHYYFQYNSSLELFSNYALGTTLNNKQTQEFLGFGLAMHIGMENGKFSLSYALGRQNDNPILVRNAKFHFGYIQNL